MSKIITISSSPQLSQLIQESRNLLVFFNDSTSAAGQQVSAVVDQISEPLLRHKVLAIASVDTANQTAIAEEYAVSALPAFIYFKAGKRTETVQGANPFKLTTLMEKVSKDIKEAQAGGSGSSGGGSGASNWRGAELPRSYSDITSQIELQRCELLNVDTDGGNVRVLFDGSKPSTLSGGKATAKDWVESDTDEQLMLFLPFQSMLKLHTLQITSLPPQDDEDDEAPMRPRTIKLFSNKPHNLGFDEAEDMAATQVIELTEKDWNDQGTANVPLRYVKFQNVTSLVMFVVDGDGDSEKVRLDRLRLIGEAGEKREMGKLEKIGEGSE